MLSDKEREMVMNNLIFLTEKGDRSIKLRACDDARMCPMLKIGRRKTLFL